MDLRTEEVIHVSRRTELNSTKLKIFPSFRINRIWVGSEPQESTSAQPNCPIRQEKRKPKLCAGGVILSSVKLHNNSERII